LYMFVWLTFFDVLNLLAQRRRNPT
jgi:hypothetical protein